MRTVELSTAYRWICDDCGREHFVNSVKAEFADGEKERAYRQFHDLDQWQDLPEKWHEFELVTIPDEVVCPECESVFATTDDRETLGD